MADETKPKGGVLTVGGEFSTADDDPEVRLQSPHAGALPELPRRRVLVVGDFASGAVRPALEPVDKTGFADLFARIAPRLSLTIDHPLESDKLLGGELGFASLKDFAPDALAERIPVVDGLLALRKSVDRFSRGDAERAEVRAAAAGLALPASIASLVDGLGAPSAPAQASRTTRRRSPGANPVDALLDMVDASDAPDSGTERGDTPIGGLVEEIGRSAEGTSRAGAKPLASALDGLLGRAIDSVLGDPAFRALEAAWRGLKRIVDHTDFRAGVRLEALACSKGTLIEALTESAFAPVWSASAAARDLIVVLHPLDATPADVELLGGLAARGASTQTLVVCAASPAFFGAGSGADIARIPSLSDLLDGPGYEKWRALADNDDAGWLALAAGDLRLRDPWRPDAPGAKSFHYAEPEAGDPPVGPGAVALASALCEVLGDLGTERLADRDRPARVDDLPVGAIEGGSAASSAAFSRSAADDMAAAGICVVVPVIDTPSVLVPNPVTARRHGPSIPQALVTGLTSRYALAVARTLADRAPEKAAGEMRDALARVLFPAARATSASGLSVEVEPNPDAPGERIYLVRIELPHPLIGSAVVAEFGFSV